MKSSEQGWELDFELDLEPDFELARGDSEAPLRT